MKRQTSAKTHKWRFPQCQASVHKACAINCIWIKKCVNRITRSQRRTFGIMSLSTLWHVAGHTASDYEGDVVSSFIKTSRKRYLQKHLRVIGHRRQSHIANRYGWCSVQMVPFERRKGLHLSVCCEDTVLDTTFCWMGWSGNRKFFGMCAFGCVRLKAFCWKNFCFPLFFDGAVEVKIEMTPILERRLLRFWRSQLSRSVTGEDMHPGMTPDSAGSSRRYSDTLLAPRAYRPLYEDYDPLRRKSDTLELPPTIAEEMGNSRRSSLGSCGSGDTIILPAITVSVQPRRVQSLDRNANAKPRTISLPAVTLTADPECESWVDHSPCSFRKVRHSLMIRNRRSSSTCVASTVFAQPLVST